jgi:sortase (surface protein transpeptidase)
VEAGSQVNEGIPPLSPGRQLARVVLIMVFVLSFMLFLQLVVLGSLQQSAAQERSFDRFRAQLANGVAPIGPTDNLNRVLEPGAPVAYLEIPAIGLRQTVGEGTTPSLLFSGPGHRRDTVLPGQIGASVIMARRAAFGGPFAKIDQLEPGDEIIATTGQGEFVYEVIGLRREGDPVPPRPESGTSRLLLATADGRPFLPDGVLRVDAEMTGTPVVGPARLVTAATLPSSEQFMGADTSTLWALALWIQAMILLSVGAVWAWHRWGRAQAWIVFLPPLILVGLATSGEVARLLPNLL